jgi:transcriptional regulator with XRE-family HTH domain
MARPPRAPQKFHYIQEWADRRGLKPAELARELNTEKSTVGRWYQGTIPTEQYLIALTGLFGLDEPASLFRHPDDDWMAELFRGRSRQELERIRDTINAAFPRVA